MKMRDLEVWGVPSYIVDIWEKNYSPYLLPVQEEAVREYGVLDYKGSKGLPSLLSQGQAYCAPRNDNISPSPSPLPSRERGSDRNNLLVIAPTSSGKTFIGEMAAITQVIHKKKILYLVPLKTLAEEKYRHFKRLYSNCGIDITTSSRDRKEDDKKISRGQFQVAIMVYEKFNYFLLKYPSFLSGVSLVVIDELQLINDPERGPLLEEMLVNLQKQEQKIKIISLSAFLENQEAFLNWFPSRLLTSYQRPVELRKGIVREGVFKYITHNEKKFGEEVFFPPLAVRDNCQEDYVLETVRYFILHHEPTLLFFPTKSETKKWAEWLAERLECPPAESAIEELNQMEETLSRDILLPLLEKGMAYHNADLSWEERNLVENYLRQGEIKVICATTTLAMGINLPFKNVILSMDKIENINGDSKEVQLTSLSFTDIENMGGRAGRLNSGREEEFGRVIFLAHSLLSETIYQNLYFNFLRDTLAEDNQIRGQVAEEIIPYPNALAGVGPKKKERDKDECRDKKKKHNCCKFLCTLVSVKNPDTELSIPEEVPIAATQGPNICTDLTGWTDIVPDALNAFDNATGTFTAPEDGDYQVSLVVNFKTSVSIPIPIPGIEVPYVEIYDPDNNPEHVLSSNFPVAFVIVQNPSTGEPALNIISILFIGQVIVNAVIPLRAGQRIRIRACTNGLQYIPLITELGALQTSPAFIDFSPPNGDTTFTIYKIRNSPTVTIHCNN